MSRRPRLTVTDHAVLRELERMHGIDIKAVRRAIARKVARGVDKGACGVLSGGLRYILCDGCVTPGSGQALTYSLKEAEARAVLADPSAAAPHIAAEAAVRGIDAAGMAALVVRAADDWRALSAKLEARRQAAKIAVAAAPSPAAARAAARIAWPPETGFRHDRP